MKVSSFAICNLQFDDHGRATVFGTPITHAELSHDIAGADEGTIVRLCDPDDTPDDRQPVYGYIGCRCTPITNPAFTVRWRA